MTRRKFLGLSLATSTVLFCGGCMMKRMMSGSGGGMMNTMMSNSKSTIDANPLKSKLPIPPILKPIEKNGVKHYDLTIHKSKHNFFENIDTTTYAINTTYLGSTLILSNNDKVSLNYTNKLDEDTTMHGHGMHLPAVMDGGVHQVIKPKETWSAQYTVNQKACTNWYHPHLMEKTAEQVYMGMAGLLIVEDDEIKSLDIPKNYGVDDIPLILQDRFFNNNGDFVYNPGMREVMMGYNGDYPITNGAIEPFVDLEAKEIRFRILNGSNSSVYNLVFKDKRSFKQIATDNSLLEKPVVLNSLVLSPAERAEIVVDFSDDMGKTIDFIDTFNSKTFLTININKRISNITQTPNNLTKLKFYTKSQAINTREFTLSGMMGQFYINNKAMDKDRIDENIPLNQIEIWKVKNDMMMTHNFHIHATHFTILERNGSSKNVYENEKGYKDTVRLPGNESVTLMVKMTDYKDNKNPYMYHCHFLEHEDRGMMGQFIVT